MITGTHFNYYLVCHRKLWLFAHRIQMEHTSDLVYEGKIIHESSYAQRAERYKELEIGGIKVDYYDSKNRIIHEIKKSRKEHESHLWQLKYYIYVLEQAGVKGVSGIIEYPKEHKTEEVLLSEPDRVRIEEIQQEIPKLIEGYCPEVIQKNKCKKCAYYDFCYSNEVV